MAPSVGMIDLREELSRGEVWILHQITRITHRAARHVVPLEQGYDRVPLALPCPRLDELIQFVMTRNALVQRQRRPFGAEPCRGAHRSPIRITGDRYRYPAVLAGAGVAALGGVEDMPVP